MRPKDSRFTTNRSNMYTLSNGETIGSTADTAQIRWPTATSSATVTPIVADLDCAIRARLATL